MTLTAKKIFNFINVGDCFSTRPEPLDFVLPGFVAGTVGGLVSAGGVGKSTFALLAGVAIADAVAGADMLSLGLEKHGRVVMLAGEDPDNAIHHRIHELGAHLSSAQRQSLAEKLRIAPCVGQGVDIHDDEWIVQIEELAKNTRLMVIDTL